MNDMPADHGRILILADDLTGALDAAAVLRRQGFGATVILDPAELTTAATASADVVALTTETRHNPDPAPVLRRLAALLPGDRLWYKKIDSTLRGAFGLEIATLLDCSTAEAALVVPALPAQGRGLRDGHLIVHGVVQATHLPRLLHEQTGRRIDHIDIRSVRAGSALLRTTLGQMLVPGAIVVIDAIEEGDLQTIADAVAASSTRLLLAGSAGLAAWLPRAWRLIPQSGQQESQHAMAAPVLCVLGSPNRRTRIQIEALRREVVTIDIDAGMQAPEHAGSIIPIATELLARGIDVALVLAAQDDFRVEAIAPETQQTVARTLATIAGRIIEQVAPGGLIVGGGDTAFAVCRELGIRAIILEGEAVPGLPLGRATTAAGRQLRVVTKAGGFGDDEALLTARAVLHGREQPA